jgi:hypothetical protein
MAQTDAERRAKQAEERATLFANDPAQLRENLTTTNTRKVGKDQEKTIRTKSVDRANCAKLKLTSRVEEKAGEQPKHKTVVLVAELLLLRVTLVRVRSA